MLPQFRILIFPLLAGLCLAGAIGQEVASPPPVSPRIRQVTLPNPVSDPLALTHRALLTPVPADGIPTQLPGLIVVRHSDSEIGYAWDPVECRLMFLWRGDSPAGLVRVAEGPGPFAATIGAFGSPNYFGYRLINGEPEFLYHHGRLAVTERIEPAPDGRSVTHHWSVHQADFDLMLAVPERWKDRVKSTAGKWSDGFFSIPKSKAAAFSVTWSIAQPPKLPEVPASWASAVAALPLPPSPPRAPPVNSAEKAPAEKAANQTTESTDPSRPEASPPGPAPTGPADSTPEAPAPVP